MNPDLCAIGERIAQIRKHYGLKQPEFAQQYGVSRNTQIDYEKGRTPPSGDYLARLAMSGEDVNWLLTGEHLSRITEKDGISASNGPIDIALLEICIEAAYMYLEITKRELSLEKVAKLIGMIYEMYADEQEPKIEGAKIIRLIDLAS